MKIFTVNIDSEGVSIAHGATLSSMRFKFDMPVLKVGMHTKRGTTELFPKYLRVHNVGNNTEIFDVSPIFDEETNRLIGLRNLEKEDGTNSGVMYFTPEPVTSGRIIAPKDSPLALSGKLYSGFIHNGRTHMYKGEQVPDSCNPAVVIVDKDNSIEFRYFDSAKRTAVMVTVTYNGTEFVVTNTKVLEHRKLDHKPTHKFEHKERTDRKPEFKRTTEKKFHKPDAPKKHTAGNYAFAGLAQQFYGEEAYMKSGRRKNNKKNRRDYNDEY